MPSVCSGGGFTQMRISFRNDGECGFNVKDVDIPRNYLLVILVLPPKKTLYNIAR